MAYTCIQLEQHEVSEENNYAAMYNWIAFLTNLVIFESEDFECIED